MSSGGPRWKDSAGRAVLLLVLLLGSSAVLIDRIPSALKQSSVPSSTSARAGTLSDITASDADFPASNWSATVFQSGGSVFPLSFQSPSGGNPGSYRGMTHVINANATNWNLFMSHVFLGLSYDPSPAKDGPIDSIDFSADHLIGSSQVSTGYSLVQGGKVFTARYTTLTQAAWVRIDATCLKETDFANLIDGTHPSFTAPGPIQFGYLRANTGGPVGATFTIEHGIDNWSVAIHRQPNSPCAACAAAQAPQVVQIDHPSPAAGSLYTLHWSRPAGFVGRYLIYRSINGGTPAVIGSSAIGCFVGIAPGPTGTSLAFQVQSDPLCVPGGLSPLSAAVNATVAPAHSLPAVPIRSLAGIDTIRFWEHPAVGASVSHDYRFDAQQLLQRQPDPLGPASSDFPGLSFSEFYDVFYSNADGTLNPDGGYVTVEATYGGPAPLGGGLNISGVELHFLGGHTASADSVASFVALGDNADSCSVTNAIDTDLQSATALGNTVGQPAASRLRLTLGFAVSSPAPQPDLKVTIGDGGVLWGNLAGIELGCASLTYFVDYENHGTALATGVQVLFSFDPAIGNCGGDPPPPVVAYPLPPLGPGEVGRFRYDASLDGDRVVQLVGGGGYPFYQVATLVRIASNETDADSSDNQSGVGTPHGIGPSCPLTMLTRSGCPFLAMTANFAGGTLGISYGASFTASGATEPYTYSAHGLPPGLTIDRDTGLVSGTPTQVGSFGFTVGARESSQSACEVQQSGVIEICQGAGALSLVTVALPHGTPGREYSADIPIVCAPAAGVDVALTGSPAGLIGTATATSVHLAGTPQETGTFQIGVIVTERGGGGFVSTVYPLEIAGCAVLPAVGGLPSVVEYEHYEQQFSAIGKPPFLFAISHLEVVTACAEVLCLQQTFHLDRTQGPPFGLSFDQDTGLLAGIGTRDHSSNVGPWGLIPSASITYIDVQAADGATCNAAYSIVGDSLSAPPSATTAAGLGRVNPLSSPTTSPGRSEPSRSSYAAPSAGSWLTKAVRIVSQSLRDLSLYYEVRDQILATTPAGRRYTRLYYAHSAEITGLLMRDGALRDLAFAATDAWEPQLRALLDGRGGTVAFTQAMADTMTALLEALKQRGSPGLKGAIEAEQQSLDLAALVGMTASQAAGRLASLHCGTSDTTLCLNGGRFRVEVSWRDFQGNTGVGHSVPITGDTGSFWFFNNTNVELVTKALDGRAINGKFWFFYGALSNVEYTITVTDSSTGAVKTYVNSSGHFGSAGDTNAFEGGSQSSSIGSSLALSPEVPRLAADCSAGGLNLCLNGGRFRVEVAWRDFQGNTGSGNAVPLTGDTGYFWFFNSANVELVVKALDGRGINGKFWLFYGALSNVEYTVTVTDTQTGAVKTYFNPSGAFASVGDTMAF